MSIIEAPDLGFTGYFEEHAPLVRSAIRRVLGHSRDEADLVQEVFARLTVRLRQPGEICVPAWLHRVAHNLAVDEARRHRPIPVQDNKLDHAIESDPDLDLSGSELASQIADGLRRLPERQRDVLMTQLRSEPLRGERLADALGVSIDAAESLLARARASLRRHLSELGAEVGTARTRVLGVMTALATAWVLGTRRSRIHTFAAAAGATAAAGGIALVMVVPGALTPAASSPHTTGHASTRVAATIESAGLTGTGTRIAPPASPVSSGHGTPAANVGVAGRNVASAMPTSGDQHTARLGADASVSVHSSVNMDSGAGATTNATLGIHTGATLTTLSHVATSLVAGGGTTTRLGLATGALRGRP